MIRKIMHCPQAVLGLAMMLLVFLVMLLAPVFAPNNPMQLNVAHSFAPPDAQYPLGTDELGRCVLSRLIYGARASLSIALPTLLLLAVISTVVATLCAYIGGALDRIFEVVSNIFMAFPPFLVAITLVGLFESKAVSIVLSIVIAMWVWNARVVRTHVLRERNQSYVITCRMSGCSELRIVFRHIIPNILPHLLVLYSTGLSSIIIMISSYAFLGLGLETGTAEWGAMFINANKLMFSHPQFLVYPGLCILCNAGILCSFGILCFFLLRTGLIHFLIPGRRQCIIDIFLYAVPRQVNTAANQQQNSCQNHKYNHQCPIRSCFFILLI